MSRSILVFILFLTACTDPSKHEQVSSSLPVSQPAASASVIVEIDEGTNMSASLSPDGNVMVLSLQGSLFTMDAQGGRTTRITDSYLDAREPAWSSDGNQIVFQAYRNGNWDLWQVDPDGKNLSALTEDSFDDREPMYSPTGAAIVFSSDRTGNYDIWLLKSGELHQLSEHENNDHSAAFSPDGSQVAYAHAVDQRSYEVRVYNLATGETVTAASDSGRITGIAWRPDGHAISYRLLTISAEAREAIAVLKLLDLENGKVSMMTSKDADVFPFRASWTNNDTLVFTAGGKIRKKVIDEVETTIPFTAIFELDRKPYKHRQRNYSADEHPVLGIANPSVANDGKRIVYSALGDLWLTNTETNQTSQLTDDPFQDLGPIFSPDSSSIAFSSDRTGKHELWILDLEDNTSRSLGVSLSGISWHPEGKIIAGFAAIPGNPLGSQLTSINVTTGNTSTFYSPVPAQQTSWSADGKSIAFASLDRYSTRYREGVYKLRIIDTATGKTTLHGGSRHEDMLSPVLSRDGETFTFVQEGLLWRAGLDGTGEPVQLTRQLTDTPSYSANGHHLVYMNGEKLILQTGDSEISVAHGLSYRRYNPTDKWVLRVGRMFDGENDGYQSNIDIVIAGSRIESIGPQGPHDVKIVDMSDKTVIPGLFEMHAHMGVPSEAQGRTWLSYGITTVRDPGSQPYIAKLRQESWDSGESVGPRTHVTGYLVDGNRVFYSVAEGIASDAHLERTLGRARSLQFDFIKTYVRLPDQWQKRVVEAAHEMGIPTSSHELFPAVSHGMDHVEHFGGTSRRGYAPKISETGQMYSDVVDLLAASGMGITPTIVFPGFALLVMEEKDLFETDQFNTFYGKQAFVGMEAFAKRMGITAVGGAKANGKALRALVDAGALVVTGTDSPFFPYGTALHGELRLYVRSGLTPFETLRAATFASATAAGVISDTGTISVGKLADIVVIDGDPLAHIEDTDNIVMTVKNGVGYSIQELLNPS
jgi:Tol biopolymer transport system component